jgi:hypothetical protein
LWEQKKGVFFLKKKQIAAVPTNAKSSKTLEVIAFSGGSEPPQLLTEPTLTT